MGNRLLLRRKVTLPVGLPPGADVTSPTEDGCDASFDMWAGLAEKALTGLHSIVEPSSDLQSGYEPPAYGRAAPGMTSPGRGPGEDARQLDPDVRARLTPGDVVVVCRELKSVFRTPPLSTARALLRLGRVDLLDELGAAGPLHAATTADARADADPELRKFEAVFARDALRVSEFIGGRFPRLRWATVHALARVQGLEHDAAREEEPGKIVHEWRDPTDPVAQRIAAESGWGWPYYGAVDTTPLFIRAVTGLLDSDPATGVAELERSDGGRCVLADSWPRLSTGCAGGWTTIRTGY